jgi:radical SAM superfamily enzyme YgiQ (UPF0313 family)
MQVALVNPGLKIKSFMGIKRFSKSMELRNDPISLEILAAYLIKETGADVKIIDEIAGASAEKELRKLAPDIVGISAMTMFAPDAYRIADYAKNNLDSLVVMGGVHASTLPEEAIKHVDIVVNGEGERALTEIVRGKIKSGIVSRPIIKNIDEIPMPARHLIDMEFYLKRKDQIPGITARTSRILTSRGCPYRCIFCRNYSRTSSVRYNSSARVIEEIKHLSDAYKIEGFSFLDENFTAYRKRVKEICSLMETNNLGNFIWACQTRADAIDLKTLKMMKEVGCKQIAFGFESGSQRILDIIKNKTVTVEQNRKAIELCKKAGIRVNGCFMIGNPTETIEDIEATEKFIDDNDIDFVSLFLTTPYPGTKLWDWSVEHKLIKEPVDYSVFTTGLEAPGACDSVPLKELRNIYIKLHAKYTKQNFSTFELVCRSIRYPRPALEHALRFFSR